MKYEVLYWEEELITVEIETADGRTQNLCFLFDDVKNYDEIVEGILSDPLQVRLIEEGRHPLQELYEVYSVNSFEYGGHPNEPLYKFLKDNLLLVVSNELFRRRRDEIPYHKLRKTILPSYPYSVDEKILLPVYLLQSVGIPTWFSCQGVMDYIVVKGRRIFVPDGHDPLAYITLSPNKRYEEIVVPFVEQHPGLCRIEEMEDFHDGGKVNLRSTKPSNNEKFCRILTSYLLHLCQKDFQEVKGEFWEVSPRAS